MNIFRTLSVSPWTAGFQWLSAFSWKHGGRGL
jgi:hypothetical protein